MSGCSTGPWTMDLGADKVRKKQLLLLKKELKCWESMFERKHGRKPTKTDIDDSPLEIRDTYRQYQKVKNNVHGNKDVPDRNVEVKPDIGSGPKKEGGDEVFGASLNKKKILNEDCDRKSERQATWKLRKWTKGEGYKTVVVNKDSVDKKSEEINDDIVLTQEIIGGNENDITKASLPVGEVSSEVPQLDIELEALSQEIKIRDVRGAHKTSARSTSPVIAGQYSKRPSTPRKPRHGHCISAKWLERCQPDLSNIVTTEDTDTDSGRTPVISSAPDAVCMVDRDMTESPGLSPCHHGHKQDSDDSSKSEDDFIPTADLMFRYSELSETVSVCNAENVQILPKSPVMSSCAKVSDSVEANDGVEKHAEFSTISNNSVFSKLESLSTGQAAKTVPQLHWKSTPSERDGQLFVELTKPLQTRRTHLLSRDVDSTKPSSSINLSTASNVHHTHLSPQSPSTFSQQRSKSSLTQEMCSNLQPNEKQVSSAEDDTKAKVTRPSARGLSSSLFSTKEKDQGVVDDQLSSPEDEKCSGASDSDTEKKSQAKASRSTSVSENFVRLNMKIKRYSKKPGRVTGSAYKRKMWKKYQRSQEGAAGGNRGGGGGGKGRNVCFRCGKPGHWAKNCTESGGFKNLGQFAGEKVQFSETLALQEEEMDETTLEQLAKDNPFPSVEEAALMARGIKPGGNKGARAESREEKDSRVASGSSGAMLNFVPPPPCYTPPARPPPAVEPLFPSEDGRIIGTPASVYTTLRKFGYESFRSGQEEAVRRILSGISTLVILSTGAGKSLCYQLPAYLYTQKSPCITLVISPLVALMEDQVRHFPLGLRGACLHTNQTHSQREKVLHDVVDGKVNVLLLSPEALVGGAFWSGCSTYSLSRLPPVAFACIDEAHCVSEWSHNFRPSYLRIYKVLKERLGVHCLLGLTATATCATAISVASHLGITEENIIRGATLPNNLHITASCDQDREQALVHLLQSPRMQGCHSIIIYCTRQQQTERISQLLRTCLQSLPVCQQEDNSDDEPSSLEEVNKMKRNTNSRKRKADRNKSVGWGRSSRKLRVDWSAECYHAGMSASQRKKVQTDFMTGKLRIVVATVAFGMGLNKADVRAIIHYNMPKSFESFVQEIGRAGRDGLAAFCHVFIDKEGSDMVELRRHTYSNTVDPYAIKQLIGKAFPKCACKEMKQSSTATQNDPQSSQSSLKSPPSLLGRIRYCAGHEVAIPIEATVQSLDVREECLSTLLCYLELQSWLEVLNPVNDACTLKCYGGPRQLRALAQKLPSVAAAVARLREQGTELDHSSTVSFSVVGLSDSMGWESHIVRSELRDLQYNDRQTSSKPGVNSTVLVEFSNLAFHLRSPGDLTTEERDLVCDFLCKKVKKQEECEVRKLHLLHAVLQSVSCNNFYECFCKGDTNQNQVRLKALIHQYFKEELECEHTSLQLQVPVVKTEADLSLDLINRICQDIYALVTIHTDQKFTGRAIARIFHGIASPCFPAEVWGRQPRFWRKHLDVDFNLLCQIATKKLVELR